MTEVSHPDTPATRLLSAEGVVFTDHFYAFEEGGGTAVPARELNVDEHSVIKTIVLEGDGEPLIILMHGDMRASVKELAKAAGVRAVMPCGPQKALEYTGYETGWISPFGTRTIIPVYMEETILNLRKVYINGGKKGYLAGLDPYDAVRVLRARLVKVGSARAS